MPRCAHCGGENVPGAARCVRCGASLGDEPGVTTVSILVVDLTRSGEVADLPAVARRAHREIRLLGGTVVESDDHLAVGVFGPPVAPGPAAERAVRASLRVAEAAAGLVPPVIARAAVRSEVPAGRPVDANDVRRTALLLPAAGVVVDEPTHRATADLFEYEPAGGADPAWMARAARGRFGVDIELDLPTPFVGRDHEMALLTDLFTRALLESAPHVVTVVGQAGIGKSRLLAEFWTVIDARPELVYWRQGRSLGDGGGVTLWALGEVVKGQAGILESDDAATAAEKLEVAQRTFLPDEREAGRAGEMLAPLVGLVPDDPRPVPREESFPAWLAFLQAVAATHPMVLVFEDLHLADPGTLAFVRYLSEHASGVPMLVLCTARLELLERDRAWADPGAGDVERTTISLAPLSGRETRELFGALGGPEMARSLPVLEAAGGNPLYVEGAVRLLEERPGAEPPRTLEALMGARLDALDSALRSLAEDAAVVGKVFWPGPLEAIARRTPGEIDEGLRELTRRELVRPARRSSVDGQPEYAFWHLVVRDAALDRMDPDRRAAAHGAALAWATRMATDRAADVAEILAYHAVRAGDGRPARDAALRFTRLAADRAAGLDPARAAELYRRAAALREEGSPEREHLTRRAERAEQAAASGPRGGS